MLIIWKTLIEFRRKLEYDHADAIIVKYIDYLMAM